MAEEHPATPPPAEGVQSPAAATTPPPQEAPQSPHPEEGAAAPHEAPAGAPPEAPAGAPPEAPAGAPPEAPAGAPPEAPAGAPPEAAPGVPPGGATSPPLDAAEMLRKVRQEDGIHYRLPVTPDDFLIPGNLSPDTELYVFGLFAPKMEKTELQFRESVRRDKVSLSVVLTCNPSKVHLRTILNKQETEDSSHDADLKPCESLVIRCKAYAGSVKLTINDKEITFTEKEGLPLDKCGFFSVFGDAFIASVSLMKPQWPERFSVSLAHQIAAGYHFTVVGTVAPDADKVSIALLRTADNQDDMIIVLSAQFAPEKKFIRNTKQEGVWLEEQVEAECPFELGQEFSLDVSIGDKDFSMEMNGKELPRYKHKVFYGLSKFIFIDRHIHIKSIRICSISHPKHWTNKPPNVKQAKLIFFNANAPACSPIALQTGHCFYVQGTPQPHAKTFRIVLAKGEGEAAEAGLAIEGLVGQKKVHVYDGQPEAKGTGYASEIYVGRLFSCRIDVLADEFKVWVNTLCTDASNVDPYDVKFRVPVAEVTHLGVYGQITKVCALTATEDLQN